MVHATSDNLFYFFLQYGKMNQLFIYYIFNPSQEHKIQHFIPKQVLLIINEKTAKQKHFYQWSGLFDSFVFFFTITCKCLFMIFWVLCSLFIVMATVKLDFSRKKRFKLHSIRKRRNREKN